MDYLVDYLDNIDARRVTPNIEPGYLQDLIPKEPPEHPEDWDTIMDDVEKKIMIGVNKQRSTGTFLFKTKQQNIYYMIWVLKQTSKN